MIVVDLLCHQNSPTESTSCRERWIFWSCAVCSSARSTDTELPKRFNGTPTSCCASIMDPLILSRSIEQAIWKVNKNQAVANVETLEEIKSKAVAPARFRTGLLAIFAGIAVLLAAVGIYGVVSYSVSQRMYEMAVRVALGASPGDLLKLVIGKATLMVMVGLALGAVAALGLTRVLASLLYDTSPTDPVTWVAAGALLAAVALLACYFPARRVTKVDPLTILRHE